jgi:hypothetical protein
MMKSLLLFLLLPIFLLGALQCLLVPSARPRWREYVRQLALVFDQVANTLIPPFFTVSYADETMSARLYRGARRGRIVGRLVMPLVDWVFALWQRPDPTIVDAAGVPIVGHCERAYHKEILRRNFPPEYRTGETVLQPERKSP